MDARKDSCISNVDVGEEFVEFVIVANGHHDVSGNDALFVVICCSITGEFQYLGA